MDTEPTLGLTITGIEELTFESAATIEIEELLAGAVGASIENTACPDELVTAEAGVTIKPGCTLAVKDTPLIGDPLVPTSVIVKDAGEVPWAMFIVVWLGFNCQDTVEDANPNCRELEVDPSVAFRVKVDRGAIVVAGV